VYPLSKTALELIPRVVERPDRQRMLAAFEAEARRSRSTQIGANHVLRVLLETRYYTKLGEGLQGGPGSGAKDVPRDVSSEWQQALTAE
jgi:hypothetical protein